MLKRNFPIRATVSGYAFISKPKRHTVGSSGIDLVADLTEPKWIIPFCSPVKIPTGLTIAIPSGWEGHVRLRSSMAENGIVLPNGIGTIDSDYRGIVHVPICNINRTSYRISPGERIAQLVIVPIWCGDLEFVEALDSTARGSGGFGSTGK